MEKNVTVDLFRYFQMILSFDCEFYSHIKWRQIYSHFSTIVFIIKHLKCDMSLVIWIQAIGKASLQDKSGVIYNDVMKEQQAHSFLAY